MCGLSATPIHAKEKGAQGIYKSCVLKHNIQLQLYDAYGVPVPGTEFWVTLNILKSGPKVTIQLPLINFETGPYANSSFELPPPPAVPGGYLYTSDGYLPPDLRPNDNVYRSWVAATDNGALLSYSLEQDPSTIPPPISGYILSITPDGGLVVQGTGTVGNIIPPGNQVLLPTDITYFAEPRRHLKRNTAISTGPSIATLFTNPNSLNDSFRDEHISDAFDGVAAWAWNDNSAIADKTNGILDVLVAIGTVDKKGKLKVQKPVNITNFTVANQNPFDTAIAINRTDKNNIIVSWSTPTDGNGGLPLPYRAVSFDGGKTWPYNGPINIQPTGNPVQIFDNPGVKSDKFGNIWYVSTNGYDDFGDAYDTPYFTLSTDGGVTYELIYTLPTPPQSVDIFGYDFPQFCFGGDGSGNYGLQYTVDYFPGFSDGATVVGFIPIYGLGSVGTPTDPIYLNAFENACLANSITASADGRVWYYGFNNGVGNIGIPGVPISYGTGITTVRNLFKSPGAPDVNVAGPWDVASLNLLNFTIFLPIQDAQPDFGFFHGPISNFYDDNRQALYLLSQSNSPDFSQNMRLRFQISRDNAQTWTNGIDISNSIIGNRGFQSMALDTVRGDLYFGWYDGRNDPTFQALEYFGAVIPKKQLDKLVNKIPLSNPLYTLPSAGIPFDPDTLSPTNAPNQSKAIKKHKKAQDIRKGGRWHSSKK